MLLFLRQIRRKLLAENKAITYLTYALGEIILVVVGILIAIQIDDWNRQNDLAQQELESYHLIITDLKKDSALFSNYQKLYSGYLDTYFNLNRLTQEQGEFENLVPDFLVSNIQFNPVTRNNHQITIEKLRNSEIRDQINTYFGRLDQVMQATDEFNYFIINETRP